MRVISRVTTSSATLTDHMHSNLITSSYHSGIIINDVADHFGIFLYMKEILSTIAKPSLSIDHLIRKYDKISEYVKGY